MSTNGHANGVANGAAKPRTDLVSIADRLEEGRALAQDVWSIFKCVPAHTYYNSSADVDMMAALPIYPRIASI